MSTPRDEISTPSPERQHDRPLEDRTVLMSKYSIGFDGRRYDFGEYRYDRLADAVAYARLMRSRGHTVGMMSGLARDTPPSVPSVAERQLMKELDISFAAGAYEFAGFRYERLADAANYAREHGSRAPAER